ncbi:MAG: hypothetical protein B6I36_00245 [Desulfobacteraceae bacterium 4572_35.1]|nr:MAG: hypothetical protein B6I36_00245 [Desulfobacteraceae bacterium 4572_35.1]
MKNVITVFALMMLTIAGCGYHLPGRGGTLPEDIATLMIEAVENKTAEPFIETQLTNEVRDQFARRQTVTIVADAEQADAILTASIISYRSNAITYNQDDDISEYRLTMQVDGKLVRRLDDEVIWQGTVQWQEEFFASDDRAEQDQRESDAQLKATKRLAQEVYNRITDNF